jgi:hypothetical protein
MDIWLQIESGVPKVPVTSATGTASRALKVTAADDDR